MSVDSGQTIDIETHLVEDASIGVYHNSESCNITVNEICNQLNAPRITPVTQMRQDNYSSLPDSKEQGSSGTISTSLPVEELDQIDVPERTLLETAESMLSYCQLLVESQQRTTNETIEFRETVKHLKTIFDEGNARERGHIEKLAHFPKVLKHLDSQYYLLKDKAKVLIRDCQEEKDKYKQEILAGTSKIQDLETEIFSSQSIYQQQATEIERLEEAMKSMRVSVSDISQLTDNLRNLEQQNKQLEIENKNAENQLNELQETYEKLISHGATDNESSLLRDRTTTPLDTVKASRLKLRKLKELLRDLSLKEESEKVQFQESLEDQSVNNEGIKAVKEVQKLVEFLEKQRRKDS